MSGGHFDGRLRRPASIYDMQSLDEWGNPMPAIRLSSLMPAAAPQPGPRLLKEKDVTRLAYLRRKLQRPLTFTNAADHMSPARAKQMELFYRRNKALGHGCSSNTSSSGDRGQANRLRSRQEMTTTSPGALQVAGLHRAERVLPVLQVLPRKCQGAVQLQQRLEEYASTVHNGPTRLHQPPPPPPANSNPPPIALLLEEGGILRSQAMQPWRATPEPGYYNPLAPGAPPPPAGPETQTVTSGRSNRSVGPDDAHQDGVLSTGSAVSPSHRRDAERQGRRQQPKPPVAIPSRARLVKEDLAGRPDTALSAVMRPWEALPSSPPLGKASWNSAAEADDDDGGAASSWHMDDRSIEQARSWLDGDD